MKYLITENRLVDFVDKYLNDVVGELDKVELDDINAREDDFEIVDENMDTVFRYMDYHLGVEEKLFYHMMNLFALDRRETEKLIEKWFDKNYPGNLVITAHPIVE
jgi:hypothetical protein